ncbi:MAG TPA: hypothetical protein VGM88_13140 [Kofleriaceae bacterium]|jgi:hypothetical protein
MSEAITSELGSAFPSNDIASIAAAIELAQDPDATDEVRAKLRDACAAYVAATAPTQAAPVVPAPIGAPSVVAAPLLSPQSPIAAAITAAIETLRAAPPEQRLDIALQHVRQAHALVAARARSRRPGGYP